MVFKKGVKCFGLLLVLSIIFGLSLSVYSDANAETKDYRQFSLRYLYYTDSSYTTESNLLYNQFRYNISRVDRVGAGVVNISIPSNSNFMAVTAKYNLVAFTDAGEQQYLPTPYGNNNLSIYDVSINGTSTTFDSPSINVYTTDWRCDPTGGGLTTTWCRTFTYEVSFVIRSLPSSISSLTFGVEYSNSLRTTYSGGANYYFEGGTDNRAIIDFSYDYNSALLLQQNQLQVININAINNLNETIDNHYNQENQAYDNISDQSASDIQGATSQQTTNIIGTISSFVTALQSVSSGSCDLSLPFPSYAGGTVTVTPCNFKDKAPTIVTIGSSLLLIGLFIPLAFVVLRMIYTEIRSWTNG